MKTIKAIFLDLRSYFLITSILFLVGASSAQHVKVIDGTRLGSVTPSGNVKKPARTAQIYRNVNGSWTQLSSDTALDSAVFAGKTVRLRIASTNNRGKLIVGVDNANGAPGGKLFLATDVGVYQVACDGASTRIGDVSTAQLTITGTIREPMYDWNTDPAWKGTCRMLSVKLRDGTEARAKVRFE